MHCLWRSQGYAGRDVPVKAFTEQGASAAALKRLGENVQCLRLLAIQSGTWHDVIRLKVLAFCEAVLPKRLTSNAKARIISSRDNVLLGYFQGCMVPPHFQL